ncbi:hypothetical protein HNY73_001736 [Argiope bruennichi]|uniref:Uncharacterized protein n=1 Tax=Argiope bruennichi TaxID=94029 RepID=A0A8T0FSA2_ARGBR|nr:hypothetical protein HNY73_001736 [Argiope bruennichi]
MKSESYVTEHPPIGIEDSDEEKWLSMTLPATVYPSHVEGMSLHRYEAVPTCIVTTYGTSLSTKYQKTLKWKISQIEALGRVRRVHYSCRTS